MISANAHKYKIETDYEIKALLMQSAIFYSICQPILPLSGARDRRAGIKPRALNMLRMGWPPSSHPNPTSSIKTAVPLAQHEGNQVWYWKPNQLLSAGEAMDLAGEPIATTLLNQHKLWRHSRYFSLYPTIGVAAFTTQQGNFPLQQMETITA